MKSGRQGGVGFYGFVAMLVFLVGGVIMASKILPLYMDDVAISKLLSSMSGKPGLESATVQQTRVWLAKGFQINGLELADDEYRIRRQKGQRWVEIRYERRIHLAYNLSLVLTFEHDWNIKPT